MRFPGLVALVLVETRLGHSLPSPFVTSVASVRRFLL
jgi:hypothetical protein